MRTVTLMAILTFLLMAIGGAIAGRNGVIMALLFAGVGNFVSYWFSDKMVLSAYKAQPLDQNHKVYQITQKLASEAKMPMPKVYLINQPQPNAFATGRNPNHAAVAVTAGLLQGMNDEEISGVIGHELGHINNRDILIGTVSATIAGAISYLGYATQFGSKGNAGGRSGNGLMFLFALILAPIAASLIRMAISRTREYKADIFGAKVSGNPKFLSSALGKLDNWSKQIPMNGNPTTSHMFIVNPFKGKTLANLFSTHPPIEERIKRLNSM